MLNIPFKREHCSYFKRKTQSSSVKEPSSVRQLSKDQLIPLRVRPQWVASTLPCPGCLLTSYSGSEVPIEVQVQWLGVSSPTLRPLGAKSWSNICWEELQAKRLRDGRVQSVPTSTLHLQVHSVSHRSAPLELIVKKFSGQWLLLLVSLLVTKVSRSTVRWNLHKAINMFSTWNVKTSGSDKKKV